MQAFGADNTRPVPAAESVEEGIVEDILFRSPDTGYTVCELAVSETHCLVAVGIMPYIAQGETVRMFGKWTRHPEYGEQLKVSHFEAVAPRTENTILRYLASGVVHGVGEKLAARIVTRFGADSLRVMREEPKNLSEIRGISLDAAKRIADEMIEKQEYQELALLLSPYGIGPAKILRIHRQFGASARRFIQENPFRLADEVQGIGFRTADQIARSLNCAPDSPFRLRSALRYVLSQSASAGHTCQPESVLLEQTERLLDRSIDPEDPDYLRMVTTGQVVRFPYDGAGGDGTAIQYVALKSLYDAETGIAGRLSFMASCPIGDQPLNDRIQRMASDLGVSLAEEQRAALACSFMSGISIITGGPGTGKTLLIRLLARLFEEDGKRVVLAAPTGQAAKRMSQAAGREARTLHRLLESQFAGEESEHRVSGPVFNRNAEHPLDTDVLIIDEISMVDVVLLHSAMSAMPEGAKLVLVGDADQLPSVGPGNVLKDLLSTESLPHTRLTHIYRQARSSRIILNAHRILRGEYPEFYQQDDSDFLYIPRKTPEDMADAAIRLCADILPDRYGYDPMRDIQVIAPSRKGPAGIPILNRDLQEALNKQFGKGPGITSHGFRFTPGDRVMQITNNYELEWKDMKTPQGRGEGIFNGETGVVKSVNETDGTLIVVFDGERHVRYDRALLDELDPAYAVTVHKSQGGEYPVVVLVLPPGPPMLLTRNLLYTAVTRARDRLFLISSREVLAGTIRNQRLSARHTVLGWQLRKNLFESGGAQPS